MGRISKLTLEKSAKFNLKKEEKKNKFSFTMHAYGHFPFIKLILLFK